MFSTYLWYIYGGLQSSCSKVHDYLRMTLDYPDKVKLQVPMILYLINLIKEFSEELGAPAATTDPDHLFKVRP